MPNLISVTQAGRAPDFLVDRLKEAPGNVVKGKLAGTALRHPALAPILDLVFPPPAYGSLTDVIKRHGYEASPDQVFTGPPGSYKYDGTRDRHMPDMPRLPDMGGPEPVKYPDMGGPGYEPSLLQLDPELKRTLNQQQSQMNAGISGTFVPVR